MNSKLLKKLKTLKKQIPLAFAQSRTLRILRIVVFICLAYLLVAPFVPELNYQTRSLLDVKYPEEEIFLGENTTEAARREYNYENTNLAKNRLVIPAIGVNIPIVEGKNENVLFQGAWRRPNTSTPDRGGNTVITGHRFHYVPPHNQTFYNLNKLENGAKIFVFWKDKEYIYKVYESFVVEPEQVEIEDNLPGDILTLYTCHPLWTADSRFVVRAELAN